MKLPSKYCPAMISKNFLPEVLETKQCRLDLCRGASGLEESRESCRRRFLGPGNRAKSRNRSTSHRAARQHQVYLVDSARRTAQSQIRIGSSGTKRRVDDYYSIELMNAGWVVRSRVG